MDIFFHNDKFILNLNVYFFVIATMYRFVLHFVHAVFCNCI